MCMHAVTLAPFSRTHKYVLSFMRQGHGGGWAGIPGLIVQCPEFICEKGYGVPINVTHPKFRGVLTDVLREIVDIFDDPPYLHLGGKTTR
jgi:hypothetical protein